MSLTLRSMGDCLLLNVNSSEEHFLLCQPRCPYRHSSMAEPDTKKSSELHLWIEQCKLLRKYRTVHAVARIADKGTCGGLAEREHQSFVDYCQFCYLERLERMRCCVVMSVWNNCTPFHAYFSSRGKPKMRNKDSVAESRGGKLQSILLVQTSPGKQSLSCSCLKL